MPYSNLILSSQEDIYHSNDLIFQAEQNARQEDKKVIQDEVELTKKIVNDQDLISYSTFFLDYFENNSEIDGQLIILLDSFVIKAEEFCAKNNIDLDAAFFNVMMFACVYKKVGKSNNEVQQLRHDLLIRQHIMGDENLRPNNDLSIFSGKVNEKIFLLMNGFTVAAGNIPRKTTDPIAQEGLAMTFGFYNNVFAAMANVLQVNGNNDIKDDEYNHIENVMSGFADSMLKGINKAIELNNPYITQVNMLIKTINTVMWKLSSYLTKWLITTKKHSKQDDVDNLLQKIIDVFYDESKYENTVFDPNEKCRRVIGLIEECILKIKNSVARNGDINVKNKTKLLALTSDVLVDLHLFEDSIKHVKPSQVEITENIIHDDFLISDEESHFFSRFNNIKTLVKPRDVAEKSVFQFPIDKIRQTRAEANAVLNNFFVKITNKLTFGLVALAISAFKDNPLLEKCSDKNNEFFQKLPEAIKKVGGIKGYLDNLKPKSLSRVSKIEQDIKIENDVIEEVIKETSTYRILSEKKPVSNSDNASFVGLNNLGFLAKNVSKDRKCKNESYNSICENNIYTCSSTSNREILNNSPFSIPIPTFGH